MRFTKKKLFILALMSMFLVASLIFAGGEEEAAEKAPEKPIKVRLVHLFAEQTSMGKKMQWVADELEKRSNGRFDCEVFAGGVAGGEKESLEDLLAGNCELANGGSYFYMYVPEANIIELPLYFWESQEEANRVLRGYWPQLVEVCGRKGYYPVGLDTREFFSVWTRDPIKSLKELEGMKFRSVNAEYWIEVTKMYGAIPNPMPFSEAYMAFKTGVCDGVVNPIGPGVGVGFQEVLKCFIDTRLVLCRSLLLTSTKFLDSLPDDLHEIFLEVCEEQETVQIGILEEQLKKDKQKMLDAGVTFIEYNQIDPQELEDLKRKGLQFRDDYMKAKGPEVYEWYKDWLAHVERETGRSQGL